MDGNGARIVFLGDTHDRYPDGFRQTSRGVIIRGDEVLLIHESARDIWMLPGGGRERDETPEECCLREVLEETGLSVRLAGHFLTLDERGGNKRCLSDYFACEVVGKGEPDLTEEEQELGTEPRWVPFDEAFDIFSDWQVLEPGTSLQRLYLREFTALEEYADWNGR